MDNPTYSASVMLALEDENKRLLAYAEEMKRSVYALAVLCLLVAAASFCFGVYASQKLNHEGAHAAEPSRQEAPE